MKDIGRMKKTNLQEKSPASFAEEGETGQAIQICGHQLRNDSESRQCDDTAYADWKLKVQCADKIGKPRYAVIWDRVLSRQLQYQLAVQWEELERVWLRITSRQLHSLRMNRLWKRMVVLYYSLFTN
ncbi:hypothetical protein CDAR_569221 [Caerostris darwini]|uniref:Uncharacterized protein n=1 Tax=Caerostris darwini TaxID=1538125 RepID=A0AAV4NPD0_9ARAC|nr:hypothetical protein CDAR_569221 [Caerostris darwini]